MDNHWEDDQPTLEYTWEASDEEITRPYSRNEVEELVAIAQAQEESMAEKRLWNRMLDVFRDKTGVTQMLPGNDNGVRKVK